MDGGSWVSSKVQDWTQQTELVLILWFRKGPGHGGVHLTPTRAGSQSYLKV